jgi:hypothetical protein
LLVVAVVVLMRGQVVVRVAIAVLLSVNQLVVVEL